MQHLSLKRNALKQVLEE